MTGIEAMALKVNDKIMVKATPDSTPVEVTVLSKTGHMVHCDDDKTYPPFLIVSKV